MKGEEKNRMKGRESDSWYTTRAQPKCLHTHTEINAHACKHAYTRSNPHTYTYRHWPAKAPAAKRKRWARRRERKGTNTGHEENQDAGVRFSSVRRTKKGTAAKKTGRTPSTHKHTPIHPKRHRQGEGDGGRGAQRPRIPRRQQSPDITSTTRTYTHKHAKQKKEEETRAR